MQSSSVFSIGDLEIDSNLNRCCLENFERISENIIDDFGLDNPTDKLKPKQLNEMQQEYYDFAIKKLETSLIEDAIYLAEEGIAEPNELVIESTKSFIKNMAFKDIFPYKVSTTVEEGICITFKRGYDYFYLEFYNDGEIGFIVEDTLHNRILQNEDVEFASIAKYRLISFFGKDELPPGITIE